jgi:transcriptional antiterminator RfaH
MIWHVAMTKSGAERIAERNLNQQGIDTYLPLTWRHIKKQQTRELIPMFPGYIIFAMGDDDDWTPIRSTKGLLKIIRFGQDPAQIADDVIEHLQQQESAEGIHEIPGMDYEPGDRVRVLDGPFKFYEAVITAKPRDRLAVLLSGMGREIKMILSYRQVESA